MYLERAHPAFLTTLVVLVLVPNGLKVFLGIFNGENTLFIKSAQKRF